MPFYDLIYNFFLYNLIVAYFLGPHCATRYKEDMLQSCYFIFIQLLVHANVCIETKITTLCSIVQKL